MCTWDPFKPKISFESIFWQICAYAKINEIQPFSNVGFKFFVKHPPLGSPDPRTTIVAWMSLGWEKIKGDVLRVVVEYMCERPEGRDTAELWKSPGSEPFLRMKAPGLDNISNWGSTGTNPEMSKGDLCSPYPYSEVALRMVNPIPYGAPIVDCQSPRNRR